ncbi:MAG TPA: response regulator [Candidatus Cybelea sp.]|jgi:DNA-binding response OmpR family regulator|nr:response regulator [Candidatus Cybelea sp.]
MPPEESLGASAQRPMNPPHRILVVEDECAIRTMVTTRLVKSGYHVDAAENGADAWAALQVNHYDLLITDNNMPKVSGVELLQRLHATRMALPVIMATGSVPREEFERKPWLEPVATLLKPYSVGELLATVKAVLRAIGGANKQLELFPNRQRQPAADGMQR